jgi:MoaA/NifB/PqqE/SkfB family radical SAM enzyme
LELTNLCNLRYRHCYNEAGSRSSDELSTTEKLRVVEELARSGVVSLALSGGEPLMATDFFVVAAKVKEEGMHPTVATNGTLISHDMARKLKALGADYVEISLDSVDAGEHDRFRGFHGAFERTLQGIKNCVAEGIYTCIATTVTKLNVSQVAAIIELARHLKVKRFIAFNFIPTGRGADALGLDLTAEKREELLKQLFIQSHTNGIEVLSTAPQYARVSLECSGRASVAPTHFYLGEASWEEEGHEGVG